MNMLTFISIFIFTISAFAMNGRTTYQAKIIKPDGYPLEASSVNFRFTVLDSVGSCVLYVEDYSAVNMSGGGGLISFALGNGNRIFPVSGTSLTFQNTFDNSVPMFNCQTPGTYNPNSNDTRKIVMQFNDGNGWQTLPAMAINVVPYAMYANKSNDSKTLNGKADTAFVENSTLAALNCNTATHAITFNGVSFSCIAVGGGGSGITSVSTSGTVLSTGGTASAPVISITAATMSSDGYLTSLDYAEFKAKLSASSTQIINTLGYAPVSGAAVTTQINNSNLSGDVSGTISSNSVVTVGGKTASQIATSVNDTLAASASNVINTIVKRDGSGNSTFAGISAGVASLNYVDIYKPSTSFNIRLQAPTSLAANYTLMLPTSSGTSGQVLSTDGSGNLSWVNPANGSVTSVSATAPLVSTGGSTPTISITQATSSTNGYLSSADFSTFNNKQNATSAAIIATLGYTPANNADTSSISNTSGNITLSPNNITGSVIVNSSQASISSGTGALVVNGGVGIAGSINAGGNLNLTGSATIGQSLQLSSMTSGSLLFAGASGLVSEDNSRLFWDGVNKRLGLGTNSPVQILSVSGTSYFSGNVGIGTTTPVTKLDVSGGVRIGAESTTCAPALAGTLRYNAINVEYCNGTSWQAFGVSGAGITNFNGSTSGTQTLTTGTGGTAPAFNTLNGVHTLNLPLASTGSVTAGLISNTDYTTFNNKITSSAASIAQVLGYVPASATALGNYLVKANNLSDLASSATARANLGLGSFATANSLDLGSASATGTLAIARLPSFSGDVTSVSGSNSLTLTNSGVSAATYTKVTVDSKGRVTSGSQLSASDVTTALGYTPAGSGAVSVNDLTDGYTNNNDSIYIGAGATLSGTASNNTGFGIRALGSLTNGSENVAIGTDALFSNTTGFANTAVGWFSLYSSTTGGNNTAIGNETLVSNTTGFSNTALGSFALYDNSTGGNNAAVGESALSRNTTGQFNTGLGNSSGFYNTTGNYNTFLGSRAGLGQNTLSNVSGSTIVGYEAGRDIRTGANGNTLLGYRVGDNITTGANNIVIGYDIDSPTPTVSNILNIGNLIFGTNVNGVGSTISTGNVGIGVSAPTAKLQLASGTSTLAPFKFTSGTLLTSPQSGTMEYDGTNLYYTDGTNTRRAIAANTNPGTYDSVSNINSSGNITLTPTGSVVVSSTTASTNSQTGALVVKGGLGVAGNIYSSGTIITSSNLQGSSITATSGMISPYIAGSVVSGGSLTLDPTTHSTKGNILLAPNGGNVGIGTTSPNSTLEVSGALTATKISGVIASIDNRAVSDTPETFSTAGMSLNFKNNSANSLADGGLYNGVFTFRPYGNATDWSGGPAHQIGFTTNGNIYHRYGSNTTWNTWRRIIETDNAGNVGIGTSTPGSALDVSGTIRADILCDRTGANCKTVSAGWGNVSAASMVANWPDAIVCDNGTDRSIMYHDTRENATNLEYYSKSSSSHMIRFNATTGAFYDNTAFTGNSVCINKSISTLVAEGRTFGLLGGGVDWTVSGTNIYRAGGNVGMGTSTPDHKLRVIGKIKVGTETDNVVPNTVAGVNEVFELVSPNTALAPAMAFHHRGKHTVELFSFGTSVTSQGLQIKSGSGEQPAQLLVEGNVGIGTSSPSGKLHVYHANADTTTRQEMQHWEFNNNTNVQVDIFGDTHAARPGFWQLGGWNTDVKLAFVTDTQANVQAGTSNKGLFIDNGNVGIGTTSPSEKLEVNGNIKASGDLNTGAGQGFKIRRGTMTCTINLATQTGSGAVCAVSFGYTFASAPVVTATNTNPGSWRDGVIVNIANKTTTGFSLYFFNAANTTATGDMIVDWVAIGQ